MSICKIIIPFSNQQAEMAREHLLQMGSLKLTPNTAQILRTPVDQGKLCIKLLIPGTKTNEEVVMAVEKIWNDSISVALTAFTHDNIQIRVG
jgi:hypothetical protein